MTVTSVHKDPEARTMTITSEFAAPIERVWQLWEDPRLLERWWGPPTYPATFVDHDLSVGSTVSYFMTGPGGDQPRGWWRVLEVDVPRHLRFESGFSDDDGHPNAAMPLMTNRVTLSEQPDGVTRMAIETKFASLDDMEKIMSMGMEEGMTGALSQIDSLL